MAAPKQQLSLFDAVSIIIGVIVGAGIFRSTPLIAGNVPDVWTLYGVWALGGILSLIGALCYAELTSSMPKEGGDYVYLTAAYGRPMGYLFAWCEFWIIRPGSIGAMAYVFATYGAELLPPNWRVGAEPILAMLSIVGLSLTNLLGVKSGKWTQNLLTMAKVVGLLAVIGAGLAVVPWPKESAPVPIASGSAPELNFSFAMIMVLFAYGGWNDISFVAAEVRQPEKNMFRSLVLGVLGVTLIYLLLNAALAAGLGLEGLAASASAPAQLVEKAVGPAGNMLVSMLICVATLGAINAMIFTGSRIYYALGKEHAMYAWLGHWSARFDAPVPAIILQGAIATILVRSLQSENQFERLVIFTTPLFWLFLFLVAVASMLLRTSLPDIERPFRMPFYPLPALVLAGTALFMIHSSLTYSLSQGHAEGFYTLAMGVLGLVLCWVDRK